MKKKIKVLVFCQKDLDNFISPICEFFEREFTLGVEMRIADLNELANPQMLFDKSVDVVWFEWANEVAIQILENQILYPFIQDKKVSLADYLMVGEAAEKLGVSPLTLSNWDRRDKQECRKNAVRLPTRAGQWR